CHAALPSRTSFCACASAKPASRAFQSATLRACCSSPRLPVWPAASHASAASTIRRAFASWAAVTGTEMGAAGSLGAHRPETALLAEPHRLETVLVISSNIFLLGSGDAEGELGQLAQEAVVHPRAPRPPGDGPGDPDFAPRLVADAQRHRLHAAVARLRRQVGVLRAAGGEEGEEQKVTEVVGGLEAAVDLLVAAHQGLAAHALHERAELLPA